jgi:AmmeMemoRadiSam system protein A
MPAKPQSKMSIQAFLAKSAVEKFVEEGTILDPASLRLPASLLNKKAPVFVTIEKNDKLRGCVGTYLASRKNIALEIIDNALAAAFRDYRFGPVQAEELPFLSYTVYILGKMEMIKDISGLEPRKYGGFVKTVGGFKSALLLPGLEGIESPQKQFSVLCQKAGIEPFKEKTLIFRFSVKKFQ